MNKKHIANKLWSWQNKHFYKQMIIIKKKKYKIIMNFMYTLCSIFNVLYE